MLHVAGVTRSRAGASGPGAGSRALAAAVDRRLWSALASVAVLFTAWYYAAPPMLGGSTSYVITRGISMLPRYHTGDLVVIRRQPSYHVGEVVAYHNLELHTVVLHRIIAIDGRHYVFKGDNNDFVDPFEPTRSQLVGAEWVHLPGVGRWVEPLRTPAVVGGGLAMLWLLSFARPSRTRRQRRRHRRAR